MKKLKVSRPPDPCADCGVRHKRICHSVCMIPEWKRDVISLVDDSETDKILWGTV